LIEALRLLPKPVLDSKGPERKMFLPAEVWLSSKGVKVLVRHGYVYFDVESCIGVLICGRSRKVRPLMMDVPSKPIRRRLAAIIPTKKSRDSIRTR
jgi:hypothetical protein